MLKVVTNDKVTQLCRYLGAFNGVRKYDDANKDVNLMRYCLFPVVEEISVFRYLNNKE